MKKLTSKTGITLLAIVVYMTATAFAQKGKEKVEKDKVLDKKIFVIDLTETGKKKAKAEPDEISFANNKFKSKVMADEKFVADLYIVTVDSSSGEKVVTFESTLKNDGGEELLWNGTVKGDDIEGTAVLSKKGKTKKEYEFSGSLKQKKKK